MSVNTKVRDNFELYDKILIKIPIFWMVSQKIILSKFARVLSWMLKSWVSIVESLRITSDAVWNEVYRQRLLLLRDDIKKWMKMYEWLENDPLFPDMVVSMIQIWEQTAKVDEVIIKLASREFIINSFIASTESFAWPINVTSQPNSFAWAINVGVFEL